MANPGDLSWDVLSSLGHLTVYPRTEPDDVVERCAGADAVFTNKVVIDAGTIASLPALRFIGVLATGYNNVDVEAARDAGIMVCNVPAYSTESVVQLVFALLLEAMNRVGEYAVSVARGEWQRCADFSYTLGPIEELCGKTMGIYGLGNIGRRVACVADAFGMKVISPTRQSADSIPPYVEKVSFDDMLRRSDVISLNAPLTADNRHIIDHRAIGMMRPGAVLINTARGPLVDEQALADALKEGRIRAAAVDVLECEPPRTGSPLIGVSSCIVTPHIAWQSVTARRRLLEVSASNLKAWADGHPRNVVS